MGGTEIIGESTDYDINYLEKIFEEKLEEDAKISIYVSDTLPNNIFIYKNEEESYDSYKIINPSYYKQETIYNPKKIN